MKSCKECVLGKSLIVNTDFICKYNGIVSSDYICRKFLPKPIKKNCATCKNFKQQKQVLQYIGQCSSARDEISLSETYDYEEYGYFGTCATFTIRPFFTENRKACSRHIDVDDASSL